jgi:hypothetical protein
MLGRQADCLKGNNLTLCPAFGYAAQLLGSGCGTLIAVARIALAVLRLMRPDDMLETISELAMKEPDAAGTAGQCGSAGECAECGSG